MRRKEGKGLGKGLSLLRDGEQRTKGRAGSSVKHFLCKQGTPDTRPNTLRASKGIEMQATGHRKEVKEHLNKVHVLRAGSPGDICSGMIKELTVVMSEILTSVFKNTQKN